MPRFTLSLLILSLIATAAACAEDATPEPIAGIGPVGPIVKLHTKLKFTEGPASDGKGDVYFTDIPANRIYRVDSKGKLSVWVEGSNHANGLMFNAQGQLVACEMDGQLAVYDVKTKQRKVLVAGYDGKRFNAPNDLVIDRTGGIYFTDPHFRAPDPLPQKKLGVYYAKDGKTVRLIDDLKAPNGVILSPDEKTLYVFPSLQAEMMAYPVESPGKLGPGRVFYRVKQPQGAENTGADGVTIDTKGNLYITTGLGLQVVNPSGKLLGIIPFPEKPANVTFAGPDNKTLYVTARTSLYKVKMQAKGHVFGKEK